MSFAFESLQQQNIFLLKFPALLKWLFIRSFLLAQLLVIVLNDLCHWVEKQQQKSLIKKLRLLGCLLLKFSLLYWWAKPYFIFQNFLQNSNHFPLSCAKTNIPIILSCEVSWCSIYFVSEYTFYSKKTVCIQDEFPISMPCCKRQQMLWEHLLHSFLELTLTPNGYISVWLYFVVGNGKYKEEKQFP